MSYRSLIWSLLSLAIVVAIVALWIQAINPLLTPSAVPTTAPGVWTPMPHAQPATSTSEHRRAMWNLAQAGLLLAFVVLCVLFTVSLILTLRSLLLGYPSEKARKTKYVDAWKLAGKRLGDKPSEDDR